MKLWLYRILMFLALIGFSLAVWFASPLIGFGESRPFAAVWVRVLIISVVWLTVILTYTIKWWRRRRAARALEEAIVPPMPTGDGEVLAEKMTEALDVLKKSTGGKAYLYDLPWYVIIGPPGAGKTTALLNSGIKFPLAEKSGGGLSGFGGTRYCDWWFSEEAVLIDTAGRYTTQDSDAEADRESWLAFLKLLKTHRARQPINGVLLAVSLEEVITGTPESLDSHAETIRQRLVEIHDQLKVDFPVYVMFTKADLVAGFMEYFGSFSASRRQKVWGATFQTQNRKETTVDRFGAEYDALVGRLSEEVTDRLNEEPDGINRISIFGFPGQVAMLKGKLNHLMQGIFESSRYKINANLRGFYFSSGTQEGTPIDQVLGAMERSFGGAAAPGMMSGKGKSFFLHDLLKRVVFAEAGWVSFDRKAVRREAVMRYGSFGAITFATLAMLGLWGWSFWQNRQLVQTAEAALADYEIAAQAELTSSEVDDDDVMQVAGLLRSLRDMPLGYGDAQEDRTITERFGLSQRDRLSSAATISYRQALERMLRSRLILRLEQQLQDFISAGNTLAVYETLKVYKHLGGVAPHSDDDLVLAWFRQDWRRNLYPGPQFNTARADLEEHLIAMLELDDAQEPAFDLNGPLIDNAERMIARMRLEDHAYSLIQNAAEFTDVEPFNLYYRAGTEAEVVFETLDGRDLKDVSVPAIYTRRGFHEFFLNELAVVADRIETDQWVMGSYADIADIEDQLGQLGPILLRRYTEDFIAAWEDMLANLRFKPMATDRPNYNTLAALAAPRSPVYKLVEGIVAETQLTQQFEEDANLLETGAAGGQVQEQLTARIRGKTSGLSRLGVDVLTGAGKSQRRAGGGAPPPLPGADIEAHFERYALLFDGEEPLRPVDALLGNLNKIYQLLLIANTNPTQAAEDMVGAVGGLKSRLSRLPDPIERMMTDVVDDFDSSAAGTSIAKLNDQLNKDVTQICQQIIDARYPFARGSTRDVGMTEFNRLFAPNGTLDGFFNQNLASFADMSGEDWVWKQDSTMGEQLSPLTLRQFQRAAEIRDAFFPFGGVSASVDMSVIQTSLHNGVREASLNLGGQIYDSGRRGNSPKTLTWEGGLVTVTFRLAKLIGRKDSDKQFSGDWAFLRMLDDRDVNANVNGKTINVRINIGGRHIEYRFEIQTPGENPFFMAALSEFRCPSGL